MKHHTAEQTIKASQEISLRLYKDTRPYNRHISNLQKGLIFVHNGTELVGEGTGFGVPVIRFQDKTYFSGSSTVRVSHRGDCATATKHFALDMISQKQFGRVKMESKPVHKLTTYVDGLYRKHKHWRVLTLANLSRSLGLKTSFVKVKPIGAVAVTYRITPPLLHIKANFDSLEKYGLETIFLLNEQSSKFFRKYHDSSGLVLVDKKIGAWEKVEAKWAYVSNKSGKIGFRLWNVKDAILHRGREYLNDIFDWVGLDYEIPPERACFEYDIEIHGSQQRK